MYNERKLEKRIKNWARTIKDEVQVLLEESIDDIESEICRIQEMLNEEEPDLRGYTEDEVTGYLSDLETMKSDMEEIADDLGQAITNLEYINVVRKLED